MDWIFKRRSTAIIMVMVNMASIMAMVNAMVVVTDMERSMGSKDSYPLFPWI